MSWKDKATNNFSATNKLITEGLYNPSIHCAYYSCVQLMYHTLEVYCKMNEVDIQNQSNDPKGSHIWIISKITTYVATLSSRKCARSFSDKLHELRRARIIADYHKDFIDEQKAVEARQCSYELNKYIEKIFSL